MKRKINKRIDSIFNNDKLIIRFCSYFILIALLLTIVSIVVLNIFKPSLDSYLIAAIIATPFYIASKLSTNR